MADDKGSGPGKPAREPATPSTTPPASHDSPARTPLPPAVTSALTLGVAGLLVVVAAVWGWGALTKPFPGAEDVPVCVDTEIKAGDDLFRDQVVVSVYNGSSRNGLAGLTLDALTERGFGRGATGNAPRRSKVTLVHYSEKNDPAALLVGKQFPQVKYVKSEGLGDGVLVIVGERYKKLAPKAPESVTSEIDSTYCGVPGSE